MHSTTHNDDEQSPQDEATLVAFRTGSGEHIEANVEEHRSLGKIGKDLKDKGSSTLGSRRHILSGISARCDGTEENSDNPAKLESL